MPTTVADIAAAVESLWPAAGAESWDAVGLVSGDPEAPVSRVLLAVDAVADTVDEAIETGADLLITHHPLLLRGVMSVAGAMLAGWIWQCWGVRTVCFATAAAALAAGLFYAIKGPSASGG